MQRKLVTFQMDKVIVSFHGTGNEVLDQSWDVCLIRFWQVLDRLSAERQRCLSVAGVKLIDRRCDINTRSGAHRGSQLYVQTNELARS